MFVVREFRESNFAPEIGCKEGIGFCDLSNCQRNHGELITENIQRRMLLLRNYPLSQSNPLTVYSNRTHQPAEEDGSMPVQRRCQFHEVLV